MTTIRYGGVDVPVESPLGIELAKWEKTGYNPEAHPYPKMLFKAYKGSDGVIRCMDTEPTLSHLYPTPEHFERAVAGVRVFNQSCQKVVHTEREQQEAHANGWRESVQEAIEAQKGYELDMQVAAAEFAHENRRLSPKAQSEIRQAEASMPEVLVDMPPAAERIDKRTKAYRESQKAG